MADEGGYMTDYSELRGQLLALTEGVEHNIANLANASALIFNALPRLNWAGFYLLCGDRLILGPFQGKPACIEIPMGRGVCGRAADERKTLVVPNVHLFEGHIACDGASNSEIVIPLIKDGILLGVLDIDSPIYDRFDEDDRRGLEELARILSERLSPFGT